MAETDGNGGDWRGLVSISSPKSNLFSGFLADGFGGSDGGLDSMMEGCSNWKQQQPPPPPPGGRNGGGSIAERRAARLGFNAPRLNTARFRTTSPLSSPSIRSPYLTIPPGLSPTSLLDSPVMLHNSQAQPSPTTGTFSLPSQCLDAIPISTSSNGDKDNVAGVESSFMFKPLGPHSFQCLSGAEARNHVMEQAEAKPQIPAPVQPPVDFECQTRLLKPLTTLNSATGSPSTVEGSASMIVDSSCIPVQTPDANAAGEQALQLVEQVRVEDTGSQQQSEGDQRGAFASTATGRPSEDGYNWRKYGQKQVKGSEYPRSYYKCTHQNCQVKKKIERSHDGQITEIIYKGGHNHPMPQPSRRSGIGSPFTLGDVLETGDDAGSYVKVEGGSTWRSAPQGSKDNNVNPDWRADGQERTSSTSVLTEVSDPLSTAQGKQLGVLESADTPELSSTLASHDDDDDRATQGSISLGDDADDDESESKRRKKDSSLIEANLASRAVREPRVVVQTDSEVDILDDGYRWRKYGQKVVKGNPNPRSYYKCTSAGCSVRKHVERASHDLKYVITTYEGKHNHEVPAARSSSHLSSAGGGVPPASSNTQAALTLPRSTTIPKPETHVQDMVPRFERKLEFSNEFFRPNNLGGFSTDMKFGPSACYDMKLPGFHTSMPYAGFGSNATHQGAHIAQVVPDYPMTIPMNVSMSGNLALSGFACNNVGKAVGPQTYISGQQAKDNDERFIRPKQEKDDGAYESHLPNSSAGMYQQMLGGYQL